VPRPLHLIVLLAIAIPSFANAGVTIHFEGAVADTSARDRALNTACATALKNGWTCERLEGRAVADADKITAGFIRALDNAMDTGGAVGVVIRMDDWAEPLYLVFGSSLRTKNFVKTQFAGPGVHIRVVSLFDALKPEFAELKINDEGGYWATRDEKQLRAAFVEVDTLVAKVKSEHPDAVGPIKIAGGRIVDLTAKR
jgi:hypothetical protein